MSLSKIRTDEAVKSFWSQMSERFASLEEELAGLAADVEVEMDDEDSAVPSIEHREISKLFKRVDSLYSTVEKAIPLVKRNVERVKA